MVFIQPAHLKPTIRRACEKVPRPIRPINRGANIEQRPWKPTKPRVRISAEPIPGKPSYGDVPPYFGPNVVDSKKRSAPAYSIGRRVKQRVHVDDGPAKFNVAGISNKGPETAPAFTIRSRKMIDQKFKTPSANKYSIAKSWYAANKTIPRYTFGKRPVTLKSLPTPAPNVYYLPPTFGTAKEGKIKSAPAFSMLGRAKPREIPAIIFPGPGQYENRYRYAQKISPRYTMGYKHKVITDEHMKPGPAAHCPEKYYKHKSVPAPSFSIRHTPYAGVRKAHLIKEECIPAAKPNWVL